METSDTTKRPAGRPVTPVPAGRDLFAEYAHLRSWWQEHKADKPPLARLAARADVLPDSARRFFNDVAFKPTAAWLDSFYPVLAAAGYEPLSNDYLFL